MVPQARKAAACACPAGWSCVTPLLEVCCDVLLGCRHRDWCLRSVVGVGESVFLVFVPSDAGGVLWLDPMLFVLGSFQKYSKILKQLGYRKLYWTASPKADGLHVFLNCVLEKTIVPVRQKASAIVFSPAKDTSRR